MESIYTGSTKSMVEKLSSQDIISDEIRKLVSDIDRFVVKKDDIKTEINEMWRKTFLELSCNN